MDIDWVGFIIVYIYSCMVDISDTVVKKPLKKRICRACKSEYTPMQSTQTVCRWQCALKLARDKQAKKEDQEAKETKKWQREERNRLKTARDHIKLTQPVFNRYIRIRDHDQPCISCGRHDREIQETPVGGKWDCGHFKSVGSHPELRFEPRNAFKQCKSCNGGSGKYARKNYTVAQSYEKNLIDKVGQDEVDWLNGPHEPKKYTIPEIQEIKRVYREKAKQLEAEL